MFLRRVVTFCFLAVLSSSTVVRAASSSKSSMLFEFESFTAASDELLLTDASDRAMADIGQALVDPEHYCAATGAYRQVKVLPAAPAAAAMAIVGFLCVSLARDRRAWLALAGGLIWLGQSGAATLPQAMRRVCSGVMQQTSQASSCMGPHTALQDACSRGQDISYLGLLRKLDDHSGYSSTLCIPCASIAQSAIITSSAVFARPATVSPAAAVVDFVVFSPAFIFSNLSRSPPRFFV